MKKGGKYILGGGAMLLLVTLSGFGHRRTAPWNFPKDFLWGSATAAHQAEGGNTQNDWWEWEQACHLENCEKSDDAADHYHRYPQDLDLAQGIGLNVYRMSIEWSRVETSSGVFSSAEFQHYRDVLRGSHARGMKTMLTLQHFTLPTWLTHRQGDPKIGGWLDPEMPNLFARYTQRVVRELGDDVDYWITVNEPNVNMLSSYVVGVTPPGVKNFKQAAIAFANFLKAHTVAYHTIHAAYPYAWVSFAHHVRVFDPYQAWNPTDVFLARWLGDFWNHQFLKSIQNGKIKFHVPFLLNYEEDYPGLEGTLDYLGINYYSRDLIHFAPSKPELFEVIVKPNAPKNDMGWEIYPRGLYRMLEDMRVYKIPMIITENGTADAKDLFREKFICDHLREVARAIENGIDVRGYIHWSLMDNFEWTSGRAPRFGLVAVDYATQERSLRPSAHVISESIAAGKLMGCERP